MCTPCTQLSLPHQPLWNRDRATLLPPAQLRAAVRVAALRGGHRMLCLHWQPFRVRRGPQGKQAVESRETERRGLVLGTWLADYRG